MNRIGLAKEGFVVIKALLLGSIEGGAEAATEVADALHNLPEEGNDFCEKITVKRLHEVVSTYPHLKKFFQHYIEFETL